MLGHVRLFTIQWDSINMGIEWRHLFGPKMGLTRIFRFYPVHSKKVAKTEFVKKKSSMSPLKQIEINQSIDIHNYLYISLFLLHPYYVRTVS